MGNIFHLVALILTGEVRRFFTKALKYGSNQMYLKNKEKGGVSHRRGCGSPDLVLTTTASEKFTEENIPKQDFIK